MKFAESFSLSHSWLGSSSWLLRSLLQQTASLHVGKKTVLGIMTRKEEAHTLSHAHVLYLMAGLWPFVVHVPFPYQESNYDP